MWYWQGFLVSKGKKKIFFFKNCLKKKWHCLLKTGSERSLGTSVSERGNFKEMLTYDKPVCSFCIRLYLSCPAHACTVQATLLFCHYDVIFIFIFSTDHVSSLNFTLLRWTDTVCYNSGQGLVLLANTNWILGSDWTWNKGRMWYGEGKDRRQTALDPIQLLETSELLN